MECKREYCEFYHNKRGCKTCQLNPESAIAKLQAKLTATEQKLAKAVRALEDAEVAYNAIISLTPTSRQREKLTEMNILRLAALKEIKK